MKQLGFLIFGDFAVRTASARKTTQYNTTTDGSDNLRWVTYGKYVT